MRIKQGTIVSMINLHLVIGNNNTCCGVVVVAGRLMAVFSRYSNNSSTFSPLLRVLGSRKRETSESILPLPETFYPSYILILVATRNTNGLICCYEAVTEIDFVLLRMLGGIR